MNITFHRTLGRHFLSAVLLASFAALPYKPAASQEFPSKPITIVVPYSAGGPTDVSARGLAEEMSKSLGVSVIVNNRPSAGGIVAATDVAKAPKDGYTLLLSVGTIVSTNPHIFKDLPYKTSDLTPISQYARWPYVISVAPDLPVKSPADLIKLAANKPDGITFGTVGLGTQSHIIAEWIRRELNIKVELVPYKGVSQAVTDLSTGRIDLLTDGVSTAVVNHNQGITRILASMGTDTFFMPEDVQTFTAHGYPDIVAYSDFGLMAPAGTPDFVIQRLYQAVSAALNSSEYTDKIRNRGEQPRLSDSPQAYGTYIESETQRWGELIRTLNISVN